MLGNRIYFLSLFISMMSFPSIAQELARLDNFGIEKINTPDLLVNLYVTENCSVCQQQVDVIKECVATDRVAAFMEGPNEEKLRTYVRRKKIPFKTYLLSETTKNDLGFGIASPSITIRAKGSLKNFVGLQTCNQITEAIKVGNLAPHK
jgi:hypothetical protein